MESLMEKCDMWPKKSNAFSINVFNQCHCVLRCFLVIYRTTSNCLNTHSFPSSSSIVEFHPLERLSVEPKIVTSSQGRITLKLFISIYKENEIKRDLNLEKCLFSNLRKMYLELLGIGDVLIIEIQFLKVNKLQLLKTHVTERLSRWGNRLFLKHVRNNIAKLNLGIQ